MTFLRETSGKFSMTRLSVLVLMVVFLGMCLHSQITGKDIGDNLTSILMVLFPALLTKMASEKFGKKENTE